MPRRLGRLEQHVAVAVAVELARRLARRRDEVALVGVHLVRVRVRVRVGVRVKDGVRDGDGVRVRVSDVVRD